MRTTRHLIVASIVVAVFAALTAPAVGMPPDSPFAGTWMGFDDIPPNADGSSITLTVGAGPAPTVTLADHGPATVCGDTGGGPGTGGTFEGRGRYNPVTGELTVNFVRNACVNGASVGPIHGIVYVFAGANVITGGGATLSRP